MSDTAQSCEIKAGSPIRGIASSATVSKLGGILLGYVAGPFRGSNAWEVAQNVRRAEEVAIEIWRVPGCACICPHTNTAHFDGAADDETFLSGDLEILRRCDFVVTTPGLWSLSSGARAEVNEARRLGLPVFFDVASLRLWRETFGTA